MKKVRKLFDELIAFLPMIIIIGLILYVSISVRNSDSFKAPMERGIKIDDQKITIGQLFEASAEDISYASHLKASGTFSLWEETSVDYSKDDRFKNSNAGTFRLSTEEATFDLKYNKTYEDEDNYKWTLSGNGELSRDDHSSIIGTGSAKDKNTSATYTYYCGMAKGNEIGSKEDYDRDGPVAIIDLEKILVPNLEEVDKSTVDIQEDTKYIKVSFRGDSCYKLISDAFIDGNTYGIYCIYELDYYFTKDAYHKLAKVEMRGIDHTTNGMNWIIDRTYSGTVTVDEV